MIIKDDLLSKLRRYFDINLYEVKLWTALLSRGVSTAGELSEIADVPRSRSYDVLESLEKKGFVVMKLGKPIKYIAIPPNEVVDRVKKNMQLENQEKITRLTKIKNSDLLGELNSLHNNGLNMVDPTDLSGSLRGRNNLYNHLDMLIKSSKSSINLMTTERGFIRKADGLKSSIIKASQRGVKVRISAPITPENQKLVDELSGYCEIKNNQHIDSRFITVDDKDMVFMTLKDNEVHPSYDMGIWVKTPYFTNAMNTLFNQTWEK